MKWKFLTVGWRSSCRQKKESGGNTRRDDMAASSVRSLALYRAKQHQAQGIVAVYKCSKCPGYCCSYPVIPLKKRDVERLAEHFGLSFKDARKKFTKVDGDEPY